MPVFAPGTTYQNLQLKAPVGLRIVIPKSNLQNAISMVGQNNIATVQWGLQINVCPETNPSCTTPTEAGEVDLIYNGSQFLLQVIIGQYYVATPITLQYEYPEDLSDIEDAIIDIYFQGKNLTIYGNSQQLFNSDMLKEIGSIQQLTSTSAYLNAYGQPISGNNDYLTYNVMLLPVVNVANILEVILPLAVVIPIIAMIPKLLRKSESPPGV